MVCANPCPLETATQGPPSPGPIGDVENISIFGFDPLHYGKGGELKISIVRARSLADGGLSVWRVDPSDATSTNEILRIARDTTPPKKILKDIYYLPASEVRSISHNGAKLFCVVDDTLIDVHGGRHPLHGGITICNKIEESFRDVESEDFEYARGLLLLKIKSSRKMLSTNS